MFGADQREPSPAESGLSCPDIENAPRSPVLKSLLAIRLRRLPSVIKESWDTKMG